MRMILVLLLGSLCGLSCSHKEMGGQAGENPTPIYNKVERDSSPVGKITKTEAEWRAELSGEAYYVLRQKGTERAFTGEYWDHKAKGIYTCGGCGLELFHSDTKYKSGTGWPSYYAPIHPDHVLEVPDKSLGMERTEVVCARCDGHLGHVFKDGPPPTGLRYCINSVSLGFVAE